MKLGMLNAKKYIVLDFCFLTLMKLGFFDRLRARGDFTP